MTIEEIEAEWYMAESPGPDCSDSEWAQKYAWKLLAVAKAAKDHTQGCMSNIDHSLDKALDELEGGAGRSCIVLKNKLLAIAKAAKTATEGKSFSGDMARPFLDLKIAIEELEKA